MSSEIQSGNVFLRQMDAMKRGDVIQGHTHNFDHTTIVFSGSCKVVASYKTAGGQEVTEERVFTAPDFFLVKAEVEHEFTALEDGTTVWCVYAHRDPQGNVVQTFQGFMDAYL